MLPSLLTDSLHAHPVAVLSLLFIVVYLSYKHLHQRIVFLLHSNIKYTILDAWLAPIIHYGPDLGIENVLALDGADATTVARRMDGQRHLASKLDSDDGRSHALSASLVDCRFPLPKMCMPLLRELEFNPSPRNYVSGVIATGDSMLKVVDHAGVERPYVGSDAVDTLGVRDFYVPVQREINRRMALGDGDGMDGNGAALRFAKTCLTPALESNVEMLKKLTGMDQVRFYLNSLSHLLQMNIIIVCSYLILSIIMTLSFAKQMQVRYSLSGSEAVDAALKDVLASSRPKKYIVRFTSAYHGHVSGVSFLDCPKHIFLPECDPSSLDFIERYHHRIAGVIVNPMQHFTGINRASPPGEKTNASSRIRSSVSRDAYARWLHSVQDKCNYCTKYLTRVAFIVDDIYFAFRTPELFSPKYFAHPESGEDLRPNVLVLGKGVAAGYPLSVVLGQKGFLNSYDKKFLLQLNKTVGTFAAWHGGIVASNIFLESIVAEGGPKSESMLLDVGVREQLKRMVGKFDQLTANLNLRLAKEELPIRLRSFSNTFSIDYLIPSECFP